MGWEEKADGTPHLHLTADELETVGEEQLVPDDERVPPPASGALELKCGHWTEDGPAVVFSNGRRLYSCKSCGLQERLT